MKKCALIFIFICFLFNESYSQFIPGWITTFNSGTGNTVTFHKMVTDVNNNIYVIGEFRNPANNPPTDIVTIKFNYAGTIEWYRMYDAPLSYDIPAGIGIDAQNNIYSYCTIARDSSRIDFMALKYSSSGNLLWSSSHIIPTYNHGLLTDALTDQDGNSYLAGTYSKYMAGEDTLVVFKINSSGGIQWRYKITSQNWQQFDYPYLSLDAQGNCIVSSTVYLNNVTNIHTYKLAATGGLIWTRSFDNNSNFDRAFDVKCDNQSSVLVSGSTAVSNDSGTTLLLKYDQNGNLLYSRTNRVDPYGMEIGKEMIINNQNEIYINILNSWNYGSSHDVKTTKYSSNGTQLWAKKYSTLTNFEEARTMCFDHEENLLLCGSVKRMNRYNQLFLKYDKQNGNVIFVSEINRNGLSSDIVSGISYAGLNNIYAGGNTNNDLFVEKLLPGIESSVNITRNNLNKQISDLQTTYDTLNYSFPDNSFIKKVYVTVDTILHTADGDLEIYLIHNGIEDTLIYRRGGPLDNFIGTRLTDTASLNICDGGVPPYTGYFAPCKQLAQFNTLPANSPWILKIYDRRTPDTGMLKSWTLNIVYEFPIGLQQISTNIPDKYLITQNYPNPFNPVTKLKFQMPVTSFVTLDVYDVLGKKVDILVNEELNAGTYEADWNASQYPSGVYFYVLRAGEYSATGKMMLIK